KSHVSAVLIFCCVRNSVRTASFESCFASWKFRSSQNNLTDCFQQANVDCFSFGFSEFSIYYSQVKCSSTVRNVFNCYCFIVRRNSRISTSSGSCVNLTSNTRAHFFTILVQKLNANFYISVWCSRDSSS